MALLYVCRVSTQFSVRLYVRWSIGGIPYIIAIAAIIVLPMLLMIISTVITSIIIALTMTMTTVITITIIDLTTTITALTLLLLLLVACLVAPYISSLPYVGIRSTWWGMLCWGIHHYHVLLAMCWGNGEENGN